ncbi:MAG: prohibitin family protein [Chlorobi bacterium]|nr:prohibitin family protein [Chlorobiota bacterium]
MKQQRQIVIFVLIGMVILVLIFSSRMFYVIKPGERAVVFQTISGKLEKDNIVSTGLKMIAPWNKIYKYDVKEQKREETMNVLDKNGLSINMDVTVRFNPLYNRIGYLHETFGKNYIDNLVVPEVRSTVRRVTGRYTAEEIYSTKRAEVEEGIISETADILKGNNIKMNALLIRAINLPKDIQKAIESKLTFEQEALAMKFVNEKEKMEAERKRIQAEGIAKYNNIINASLTDRILKQRGIEATIQLANSPNTKVIVIGSGKDGMPLILGNN